jgi:putative nucleotidyltransferase with HDIG domain
MLVDFKAEESIQSEVFSFIKQAAAELGQEAYVIGGFVRDAILERGKAKDIDIVSLGDGIELAKKVAELLPKSTPVKVFKNFGTAMLRYEDIEIEFVGARKESYSSESRNPEVSPGLLSDDQNRRDFTINALAISLNESNYGQLVDPFGGLNHLEEKLIKTPLVPEVTYSDDPLRMLRAIRFACQLNFEIEAASFEAIKSCADRISIISQERVVDELNKILSTNKPSIGFELLYKSGLLNLIMPELTALDIVEDIEGQSHKNNFFHTLEVVDNIAQTTDDLWMRWAALLHDIGKAPTKKFVKGTGWTFHAHEFVGSKMVVRLFRRLKMPLNNKMKLVQKMVLLSSRPIVLAQNVTDSAVRRLIFDAGEDLENLMLLCEADITTKNPNKFKRYHNNFKEVRKKIKEIEERDHVRNFQPPVSGELIMETFDLKPGKEIGIIKERIKEAVLDGQIPNEFEAAKTLMMEEGAKLGLEVKSSLL